MGIIKRANLESYTRDAVPMDLGDLHRRGQAVIQAAQEQAELILQQAQADREKLVSDAEEFGKAKGYEEGLAKGTADGLASGTEQAHQDHGQRLEELNTKWNESLEGWERQRSELMLSAQTEVIKLAAHIAARVIKRVVDLDPEVVVDQLEAVLDTLVTPSDIRVNVHPDDVELLKRVMPGMIEQCARCQHADLVEDDSLAPGSCVISTKGGGEIDASIRTQFDRIVATLLPAHQGPEYDRHLENTSPEQTQAKAEPEAESKGDAA